jgi:hypothetical protein
MGMRTILRDVPQHLINLIEAVRARLSDKKFLASHRVRPQDFTRERQLTFSVLMLFILQKTVKSIQSHLHEFLGELAGDELFESVTPGAVTHARAKLKYTAFIELNQQCVVPAIYGEQNDIQRWRGHRLLGIDSALLRLPNSQEVGEQFGWQEVSNQHGATGTRYPEGRASVLYDLRNRVGLDARLESSTVGEVELASRQLEQLQAGDIEVNDRGFTGYLFLAQVGQRGAHFIARCSTGSFLAAQQMFRLRRARQSKVVWLFASPEQKAECQRLGLPLKMEVRFVSLRLPDGKLEVLATSLLDEKVYPTEEFLMVYHWRWEHETFHLMLKSRLELENFSGETVEAVRQDFHAAVLLCNLESALTQPAQAALSESTAAEAAPVQVNRSVSYHALKDQLLDLLYQDRPAAEVIERLTQLFMANAVPRRPDRKVPRRKKPSFHRSYHFQRRVKKTVF